MANILRRLPSSSHYVAAQRDDPDVAEVVAALPADRRRWRPPAAEWSLLHELTASHFDRLGDWMTQFANANRRQGAPAIKPPPRFPRPVTEIDRIKARAEQRIEAELDALIEAAHATYAAEHADQRG